MGILRTRCEAVPQQRCENALSRVLRRRLSIPFLFSHPAKRRISEHTASLSAHSAKNSQGDAGAPALPRKARQCRQAVKPPVRVPAKPERAARPRPADYGGVRRNKRAGAAVISTRCCCRRQREQRRRRPALPSGTRRRSSQMLYP